MSEPSSRSASDTTTPFSDPPQRGIVPLLLAGTFFLALGSHLVSPIRTPEFFFRLTIGHWIQSNGTVPTVNLWTHAGAGAHWQEHGWLFDLLLSVLEGVGGDRSFIWTKLILNCALLLSLHRYFVGLAGERFFAGLLTTLVGAGLLVEADLLPGLVGWILFPMIAGSAARLRAGDRSAVLALAGWSVLSMNGAGDPILVALPLAAGWLAAPSPAQTASGRWALTLAMVWFLAAIATPYLWGGLCWGAARIAAEVETALRFRSEPATVFEYRTAFAALLWLLVAVLFEKRTSGVLSPLLLLAAMTTVAGAVNVNALPYALLATGVSAGKIWATADRSAGPGLREGLDRFRAGLGRLSPAGMVWLLSCAAVVNIVHAVRLPTNTFVLPGAALDFVLDRSLPFPVFHERAAGYYMVYRLADPTGAPRAQALADDRVALLDRTAVAGDEAVNRLTLGWEHYFDRYAPRTVVCRIASPLYSVLKRDPKWTLSFEALHALDGQTPVPAEGAIPAEVEDRLRPYLWAVFHRAAGQPDGGSAEPGDRNEPVPGNG